MSLWDDNDIQFPRFICEADAAGAFTNQVLIDMAVSMDLSVQEVGEIIDRASQAWAEILDEIVYRKEN